MDILADTQVDNGRNVQREEAVAEEAYTLEEGARFRLKHVFTYIYPPRSFPLIEITPAPTHTMIKTISKRRVLS